MRRIVIGGIAAAMGVAVGLAPWASAGGNGAQKSALAQASGNMGSCQESDGNGTNGWAILNAPGQPTAVKFLNGEVHLVGGTPGTTYDIDLGMSNGTGGNSCADTMDTLTTNGDGIGNGHIDIPTGTAGTYFIALFDSTNSSEQYATGPLIVS